MSICTTDSELLIVTPNIFNVVIVNDIICACSPTLRALRVLRNHDMGDAALQIIFRAVVVAKLFYAASAWWGFTTAADRSVRGGAAHHGAASPKKRRRPAVSSA